MKHGALGVEPGRCKVASDAAAIEVRGLTKRFSNGHVANAAIDLCVSFGEVLAILGPNGAGKTTLIRQIVGLEVPDAGEVRLAGRDVVRSPERASEHCAVLPQQGFPLVDLTVREAIEHMGRLRGLGRYRARAEAAREMARWELTSKARRRVGTLSGGEQRLVGLAATLVGDRAILIVDEPTNDVDPELRVRIWERLAELARADRVILVVTHNVREVESVASRVVMLHEGRVLASGAIGDLRASFRREDGRLLVDIPEALWASGRLRGIGEAHRSLEGRWVAETDHEHLGEFLASVAEIGASPVGLRFLEPSLEEMYVHWRRSAGEEQT